MSQMDCAHLPVSFISLFFLHMYAVVGRLGSGDSCTDSIQCISVSRTKIRARAHTHAHAHTGCQSCSFSASHIILYKSYINVSSTAFFFSFFGREGYEPLSHTSPESHYTGQTYLHTPIDTLYNQLHKNQGGGAQRRQKVTRGSPLTSTRG